MEELRHVVAVEAPQLDQIAKVRGSAGVYEIPPDTWDVIGHHHVVSHLLPVVVGSLALVWLLAPLTIDILNSSQVDLWDFDVVLSAVVLVEVWVLGLAIWSSVLTVRMIGKIRRLSEEETRGGS